MSEMRKYKVVDDFCRNAVWNPEDEWDIRDEIWQMKMRAPDRENGGLMDGQTWFNKLERAYNDHRNIIFNRSQASFEPKLVTPIKHDMVTNEGVNFLARLGTGEVQGRWFNTYAVGTGNTLELPNDSRLISEVSPRADLRLDGMSQATGDGMVFQALFPPLFPSADIYEAAVFNQAVGGEPLFRTVFDEETKIIHVSEQDQFTPAQTVRMVPIPTEKGL